VPWQAASQDDCVACHQADYNAQHTGSGFPTSCKDCHTVNSWDGATFNHDLFFPINSGSHQGKWSNCQQCHPNAADYSVFTCLTCHSRAETDPDHDQVSGYSYDSLRCLACHPRGD
jgi:hypothetical protein